MILKMVMILLKQVNDDIVITGYSYNDGMPNLFLVRVDSELNTLIDTVYSYEGIYVGNEVLENTSNQLIITGDKYDLIKSRKDILVSKIDNLGNILWNGKLIYGKTLRNYIVQVLGNQLLKQVVDIYMYSVIYRMEQMVQSKFVICFIKMNILAILYIQKYWTTLEINVRFID